MKTAACSLLVALLLICPRAALAQETATGPFAVTADLESVQRQVRWIQLQRTGILPDSRLRSLDTQEKRMKRIEALVVQTMRTPRDEHDLLRLLVEQNADTGHPEVARAFKARLMDAALAARGSTYQGAMVEEALQILGQIVVDRALQEGWTLLRGRLLKLLKCDSTALFTRLCAVVKDSRIQSLVSDPGPLLQAAAHDLLAWVYNRVERQLGKLDGFKMDDLDQVLKPEVLVQRVAAGWERSGADGAMSAGMDHMVRQLRALGQELKCPAPASPKPVAVTVAEQAMWAVAQCLIDTPPPLGGSNGPAALLATCSVEKYTALCQLPAPPAGSGLDWETGRAALADLVRLLFPSARTAKEYRVAAKAMVQFALQIIQDLAREKCAGGACGQGAVPVIEAMFGGFKVALLGILEQQWQEVTRGSLGALTAAASLFGEVKPAGVKKLFHLLVAIGQYAQTYDRSSVTNSAEARRKILEELIDSMINRAEREGGFVLSLGGSFGVGGGYRVGADGEGGMGYGPFMLPLGLGLQSYPDDKEKAYGFHAMLGVLDIGQYVRFEEDDGEVKVGEVDAEDSVSISLHLGVWFGSRTIPIIVAAHLGVSPFIRDDDVPVFYFGAMAGAYVPFLDFW